MNTFKFNDTTIETAKEIPITSNRVVLAYSVQDKLSEKVRLDRFNVYLLDKIDNVVWQVQHDIPNTKPFKSLRMQENAPNLSKLIASCDTDYPWQTLDFEIDLLSGVAVCIKDTHGIWV